MKPREVRKLSDEEIDIEITRLRRRLFELNSQSVTEKIHDTSQFGKVRKVIARLLTERKTRTTEAVAR